jgi:hypothetical protein
MRHGSMPRERRAFWDAHRAELTQAYPDQFVAVRDGQAIGHDTDLMSLVQHVRIAGHDIHDVWIELMPTGRRKLIL